jgi:AdoMet-dependent heme synthase
MVVPLPILEHPSPSVPLAHLDELWFQVTGTRCNLSCRHCFISCSPHNHSFGFLDPETIHAVLEESVPLGVKEYYFTGGEPFLHPRITEVLELTLGYGPVTVLTNGTVFQDDGLERLARAQAASRYSLEFRVSVDGYTADSNDSIRGDGTFERICRGIRQLLDHGFLPLVTVALTQDHQDEGNLLRGFVGLLKRIGYDRPRLNILPTLRIGAEVFRQRGYAAGERVTPEMLEGFDETQLLCNHARVVSDRGIHVCPILLEAADSILGKTLKDSLTPFALRYQACFTCYQFGALCSNPSGGAHDG